MSISFKRSQTTLFECDSHPPVCWVSPCSVVHTNCLSKFPIPSSRVAVKIIFQTAHYSHPVHTFIHNKPSFVWFSRLLITHGRAVWLIPGISRCCITLLYQQVYRGVLKIKTFTFLSFQVHWRPSCFSIVCWDPSTFLFCQTLSPAPPFLSFCCLPLIWAVKSFECVFQLVLLSHLVYQKVLIPWLNQKRYYALIKCLH